MTVLIDPPNAAGHGRLWSHLASDTSYDELHAFARGLGVPERGFDRDHYDVPAEWYDRVVAAGALPVSSRELISRLRHAGLRRRKSEALRPRRPGRSLLRPRALRRGDVVALVAPAGPADGERVEAGAALLASWGLEVRPAAEPGTAPYPWLVDHDEARAEALADAWRDPEVAAVWCVRGGFGAHRILDLLDWDALALAAPKTLIGFSDVTALHQAFASRLGVATVHGPMAASLADRDVATREAFRALLMDGEAVDVRGHTVVDGEATGPLVGGNLTVLATSSGTPLTHPAAGSIAVLEDVGEEPYRLDRSVTQLLRAGWFDEVRGIVLGQFTDCRDPAAVRALLADRLGGLGVPLLADAAVGHEDTNLAVPLGVRSRIADGVLSFPG
ncbi:DUF4031 domain-containing protein [Nocardioides guangzhouensis]|uniref:DUF4031 domain-containing protein n=1 Tax=Nocardioides guangzhouensis TaxID=2497878 RepID=A0A4Q4ZDE8_9ACTN|nr:DUF4031 domain-containing protein [Nocardioides guangzhouensis]RYP86042.1 DUF4031 domain-containing protein [Nocardioides guangzhouensis]